MTAESSRWGFVPDGFGCHLYAVILGNSTLEKAKTKQNPYFSETVRGSPRTVKTAVKGGLPRAL